MKHFKTIIQIIIWITSYILSPAQEEIFFLEFQKQANLDSLNKEFKNRKISLKDRPKILLKNLMDVHRQSKSYISEIQRLSSAEILEHFWIVNVLALKGIRAYVLSLEKLPYVSKIYTSEELVFKAILPKEPFIESNNKAIGEAEQGLVAIGARKLWELGYTGRGRLVLSFDTGVWSEHPSIKRGFLGNYRPYNQSWKTFHGVEEPADKSGSHGTHTIGTMLGLNPTNLDTIGLAFQAYYMAMDPIVVNLADTLPFVELMAANQWALNPDGDTATTYDIPDVICNSWGRPPGGLETSYCFGIAPQMLLALELAGIASEYSAGNDGPDSASSSAPGYVALSEVNAFSVGAIHAANPTFTIASFSSRGPTPCPATGTLNIKPDVVAPGVNIRSCVGANGYAFYSGTSMAGPHVAGALLLLKEAFPYLPGEMLKEALYYSAKDLGPQGEDNIYGRGIVQVDSAFQWIINQGFTPIIPGQGVDLAISEVLYPNSKILCQTTVQPQLIIKNFGNTVFQGNLKGTCQIVQDPNSLQNFQIPSLTLNPGQSQTLLIPVNVNPVAGANELWLRIFAEDTLNEPDWVNNEKTIRFWHSPMANFPFSEQFEGNSLKELLWYVENPDKSKTWDITETSGQVYGNYSARMNFYGYSPQNQKDQLISLQIPVPSTNDVALFFDYSYKFVNSTKRDSLLIKVSQNCGVTFQTIVAWPADSLNTMPAGTPGNFVPSAPEHWKTRAVDLSPWANGNAILINFYTSNKAGSNFYLDNIHVVNSGVGYEFPEKTSHEPVVWPNPSNGILYCTDASEYTYRILNKNGTIMLSGKILSDYQKINLTELSSGFYVIEFYKNQSVYRKKLIVYNFQSQ